MNDTIKAEIQRLRNEREHQDAQLAQVLDHLHALSQQGARLSVPESLLEELHVAVAPRWVAHSILHSNHLRA